MTKVRNFHNKPGFETCYFCRWAWVHMKKNGSPWVFSRSVQLIMDLWRKNCSATATFVGEDDCERSPGYLFTVSARWMRECHRSRKRIISIPRTWKNMLLLNCNLLFSWRSTALGCILSPRQLHVPMFDFIIYLQDKHSVMVGRLPKDRLIRRYRP